MRVSTSYGYVVSVYQARLAGTPIVHRGNAEIIITAHNPWLRFKSTGVRI